MRLSDAAIIFILLERQKETHVFYVTEFIGWLVVLIVRSVATSFLTYRGKILVLKRSGKVGSYQGAWAGVSGYVEEDEQPLDTALKEVEEETG